VEAARAVLKKAPGLQVIDEPARNEYPQPLFLAEQDDCAVGRLRRDCALENGLAFWVSGDQLLKGAALNAVQIAEELLNADAIESWRNGPSVSSNRSTKFSSSFAQNTSSLGKSAVAR
jgi:hypothetical protein